MRWIEDLVEEYGPGVKMRFNEEVTLREVAARVRLAPSACCCFFLKGKIP